MNLKKWVQTIWLSGLISLLLIKVFGCLNHIEIDNSHVTADDFRKQEETKEWE